MAGTSLPINIAVTGAVVAPGTLTFTGPATGAVGGSGTVTLSGDYDGAVTVISMTPAVCTVGALKVTYVSAGTCTLNASVTAGTNYTAATALPYAFLVTGGSGPVVPDFMITPTPAMQTAPQAGGTVTYVIGIAAVPGSGFTGTVVLTATPGLPSGATATLSSASVTAGGTSTLTVTLPKSTASLRSLANTQIFLALLVLPLMLVGRRGRHLRLLHLLMLVLVFGTIAGVAGCGSNGSGFSGDNGSTPAQKAYTVTVTGTSGTLVHSTTVTLMQ